MEQDSLIADDYVQYEEDEADEAGTPRMPTPVVHSCAVLVRSRSCKHMYITTPPSSASYPHSIHLHSVDVVHV